MTYRICIAKTGCVGIAVIETVSGDEAAWDLYMERVDEFTAEGFDVLLIDENGYTVDIALA